MGGLYEVNRDLGIGGNNHQLGFTSVDETYKIIPENYKGIIKTKLDGTFYTNEDGKVYYEHDKPLTRNKIKNSLDCPAAIDLGYDFEIINGKGTITGWTGTVLHLVIPEAFLMNIDGVEECVPVKVIGKGAFMQGGFKSIVIPGTVEEIEEDAFKDNIITHVEIPHSVTDIGDNAFAGNDFSSDGNGSDGSGGSGGVVIKNQPGNVSIGESAFGGYSPDFKTPSAKDVGVIFQPGKNGGGVIISGQNTKGKGKAQAITIPDFIEVNGVDVPVTEIAPGAYQGQGLISVKLPSGLERIEDYAFAGNQLEGITIPDKVNYIGNYAFAFNEQVHSKSGKARSTIKTIIIKGGEQIGKVNEYGDIHENNTKVDRLNGEVELLNHIFVTSIGNHVIDNEYVDVKDPVDPVDPIDPVDPTTDVELGMEEDFQWISHSNGQIGLNGVKGYFSYTGSGQSEIEIPHVIKGIPVTSYYLMFSNSGEDITKVVSTNPNVTNMYAMFWQSQAKTLDLSSFNTENVTNMNSMFRQSQAKSLDLSSFDTSKVTDMSHMFRESKATTGYAKTPDDANRLNNSSNKPAGLTFKVKPIK